MGHRDEVASGKGAMRWTGSILFCIMLRAHTGRNDLRGLRIQISQERGRGQMWGECFCPQRVFWAMLPMLWVQFLLKEKGRVGILTRWPVASVHGVLLSSAAGFVPGCSLQKSKQHFRGTRHPCDGADGYLALGRVPKGSGGPKRAGL